MEYTEPTCLCPCSLWSGTRERRLLELGSRGPHPKEYWASTLIIFATDCLIGLRQACNWLCRPGWTPTNGDLSLLIECWDERCAPLWLEKKGLSLNKKSIYYQDYVWHKISQRTVRGKYKRFCKIFLPQSHGVLAMIQEVTGHSTTLPLPWPTPAGSGPHCRSFYLCFGSRLRGELTVKPNRSSPELQKVWTVLVFFFFF